ncbi:MAG: TRAP transporter permease DctM/Q, partial [Magnetovibrio sp.]|nr:TRAP transporter permease DctM/Q [Magnetovibrio sp.]
MELFNFNRWLTRNSCVALIAFAMSAYHLYTGFLGAPIGEIHYPIHLLFAVVIIFMTSGHDDLDGIKLRLARIYDTAMILLAIFSTGYLFLNAEYLTTRMALFDPVTPIEYVLGVCMMLVILEAARRSVGWALVIVLFVFLIYSYFGKFLPFPFWHRGYATDYVIDYTYLTTEGVFGVPIAVMASYVFHFVLFGSFLVASGAGDFFTDFARALTGRTVGGSAKTAVVSSTLMGMLSGSSAANVVTTGSFTIPAMRKSGYSGKFAAGVEAVASSGGQITPPIMGAAAFIMMEFIGVDYATIMGIAVIPAILYFFAVFFMVDLEARRLNLKILYEEDIPKLKDVLKRRGYLLISIGVMLYLLIDGWTPTTAAVYAIASLLLLLILFDPENRRRILLVCWDAMTTAPRMVVSVTIACAVGGILVGLITLTGLGLRMSTIILDASGGYLIVILILTMIMGVVLGMGMPTSGAYIILAALLAPGLEAAGVQILAAHMFIMYVAAKSSITPPVAIASYAAAAIAGTDPWKTSLLAFKLGLSVFIIPYMFVYGPALLGLAPPIEVV